MKIHHPARPKADLYLCYGKCGLYKPGSAFTRISNKSGIVYARMCRICQRASVGQWLANYYQSLRDDPIKMLEAINKFDQLKPSYNKDGIGAFYKWLMAKNSLLCRLHLIEKKPFDIIEYVMRKVKYGRLSQQEAEERINSWYERHPEVKREDR